MSEMRACKECGKLFMPKGREKYCPDIHYRPCPVCGKPVEAKYLSDPARTCSDCRGKKGKVAASNNVIKMKPMTIVPVQPMKVPSSNESIKPVEPKKISNIDYSKLDTSNKPTLDSAAFCDNISGTVMMYIGNEYKNNFIPGHEYLLKVQKDNLGTYDILGIEDTTLGETVNMMLPVSSQISFYQHFAAVKEA